MQNKCRLALLIAVASLMMFLQTACSTVHSQITKGNLAADAAQSPTRSERLAEFLNLNLYAIETVTVDSVKADTNFHAHLDYQIELEKKGTLFGAGPLYEGDTGRPSAGLIIVRASSIENASKIADADPMHASGAREYSIRRWKLNEGAIHLTINFSDQSAGIN